MDRSGLLRGQARRYLHAHSGAASSHNDPGAAAELEPFHPGRLQEFAARPDYLYSSSDAVRLPFCLEYYASADPYNELVWSVAPGTKGIFHCTLELDEVSRLVW